MRRAWPMAVILAGCYAHADAQILSVTQQKPARDFGILVGDVMRASAAIRVVPGTVLDRSSLPAAGPVSASIDVRRVDVAESRDGALVTIRVDYQSFFAPPEVAQAEVPGYSAVFSCNGARLSAAIPAFTFTASPFRHDLQAATDPALLRPDHPAVLARDPAAPWLTLAGGALALPAGLMLLARSGWGLRPMRGPFAAADRHIAGLARSQAGPGALQALHRAFDATAGRRVFAGDVDSFLDQHPHFAPLRGDIEDFFLASREAFFGPGAATPPWHELARVARALRRAERRS